jgi:sentrin-specific protease 1
MPSKTVLALCSSSNLQITRHDLDTVVGRNAWCNDEVVNLYLQLASAQYDGVTALSSFFYTALVPHGARAAYNYGAVRRWTKQIDIFRQQLALFPINHGNAHWTLVAVFPQWRLLQYYDSLTGPTSRGAATRVLNNMKRYLSDEHLDKKGTALDVDAWTVERVVDGAPLQGDASACGVFTVTTAAILAAHIAGGAWPPVFPYTQAHVPALRTRIAADCLTLRHTPLG